MFNTFYFKFYLGAKIGAAFCYAYHFVSEDKILYVLIRYLILR